MNVVIHPCAHRRSFRCIMWWTWRHFDLFDLLHALSFERFGLHRKHGYKSMSKRQSPKMLETVCVADLRREEILTKAERNEIIYFSAAVEKS